MKLCLSVEQSGYLVLLLTGIPSNKNMFFASASITRKAYTKSEDDQYEKQ
jgi:hypothetical protein